MPNKGDRSSFDKGTLLEQIVAKVHQVNGLQCETRVFLPSLLDGGGEREIDVLVTASVGPFPVQFPIECKNWGETISIDNIDAYDSKLREVGLNVRGAMYVTTTGFQKGAVAKARALGITLLRISGLTRDRLQQEVISAAHAVVFICPSVLEFSVDSASPIAEGSLGLQNPDGEFGGLVFDLMWRHWIENPVSRLGEHDFFLEVDEGWGVVSNGVFSQTLQVRGRFLIEGNVLVQRGTARRAFLHDYISGMPRLGHLQAEYESPVGVFELARFTSESDFGSIEGDVFSSIRILAPKLVIDSRLGRLKWLPDDESFLELESMFREDPEAFLNHTTSRRLSGSTDISYLFTEPSSSYVARIRSGVGASWNPGIWDVFSRY